MIFLVCGLYRGYHSSSGSSIEKLGQTSNIPAFVPLQYVCSKFVMTNLLFIHTSFFVRGATITEILTSLSFFGKNRRVAQTKPATSSNEEDNSLQLN